MTNRGIDCYANVKSQWYIWINRCSSINTLLNGTSRFEGGESHLEDNIPKTLQRVYFPIAGYSEHERRENQSEKKTQD